MKIEYRKINNESLEKVGVEFDSDWIIKYNMLENDMAIA